jgi:two-component system NtrC family sensor kinase
MPETLPGKSVVHVPRGGLFRKYVTLFVAVVCAALATKGLLDGWFSFQEQKELLGRIQQEQAKAAALRIGLFVKELQGQLGWGTQFPWRANSADEWQFDAARLLRQVEAITELKQLDAEGRQQFCSSRYALCQNSDVPPDFSRDPAFVDAVARGTYFGPVHFERGSEPFMTVAMRGQRSDYGVIVAHVNLKLIWDLVTDIKVGVAGRAYVVDLEGRLIAHPDISLVLRMTDMSHLAQVQRALEERFPTSPEPPVADSPQPLVAQDIEGRNVLSQHARAVPVGWIVFVEQPVEEAYAPIYKSFLRSGRCATALRASARVIWRSGLSSKAAMSCRSSVISSTAWQDSCRILMRPWNVRSKTGPANSHSRWRSSGRWERAAKP